MPDADLLLARIGLAERPPPTLAGLRAVHRAYVTRMPYETLAIFLGEHEPLDLDRLQARVLAGGRGGYCFELNGLLAWLLEALGFTVERRDARVAPRGADVPTNHLALVVFVPGGDGTWLADAGLGEGWTEPLPLVSGTHGALGWTLEREPGAWWIGHHTWGSFPGFTMLDPVVDLAAFAPHHERLQTHPESSFVGALVVQHVDDEQIVTLRARTLTVRGPEIDDKRVVSGPDDFRDTLLAEFGIVLGEEERLWLRVCAQHEAFVARS